MKLFDAIPRWSTLSHGEKFLLLLVDIFYSAITLGLPLFLVWKAGKLPLFYVVGFAEAACGAPPLPPGVLTLISIYKPDPRDNTPWSDELEDDSYRRMP